MPAGGDYNIQAWGAQGGENRANKAGGKGAFTSGRFQFQTGHKLYIVVGQKGETTNTGGGGGPGGGGSFIYETGDPKLIAAGGGGASWLGNAGGPGNNGRRAGAGAFRVAIKNCFLCHYMDCFGGLKHVMPFTRVFYSSLGQ